MFDMEVPGMLELFAHEALQLRHRSVCTETVVFTPCSKEILTLQTLHMIYYLNNIVYS